jgi:hypothetical protein
MPGWINNHGLSGTLARIHEEENELSPGRLGLQSLLAQTQSQANAVINPFQSVGYQAQVGSLTDALRMSSQSDASRAGALGLDPGLAAAAGAGGRSMGLAEGIRGAAAQADASGRAERSQSRGLLASLLGMQTSLEQDDEMLKLQREQMQAAQQSSFLSTLGGLAGTLVGTLVAPGVGTAAGGAIGSKLFGG